ncbi:hypothetical protein [Winogradskyella thalassocola]|uniref:Uncharacterized protein n=1 Tax=Winogradskyella thalassocola TaxID=262004 RepID=A0A1G8M392_9FLAO|nr:hypothetical protein [Winogradskyella thalassocola]SDI62412.1 hypothetical protein SAMN04489796_11610 [Winogradskyella thalassocola]
MKTVRRLFNETIPVIIGILIALLINNWNEDRKDKIYLNQIFSSIESELEDSSLDIKRVIPKQLASVDTLNTYMDNDNVTLYEIMMKSNGIQSPTIKTNSWNAIANSKIELIDYKKLSALSDIEERKQNLIQRIERQMEYGFQNFEKADKNKKVIFKMMILDIIGAEKELQSKIEELIKK